MPAWMTTVRWIRVREGSSKGERYVTRTPMTLSGPMSLMSLSWTDPLALPWASVSRLPRSPTWRTSAVRSPCVVPWGLTGRSVSVLQKLGLGGG